MVQRSKGKISKNRVVKFPTRINTDIFKQSDMHQSRKVLNLSLTKTIICTTGRLSALKGWKFMIDSFKLFESKLPESHFIIIGEGEDFYKIQDYISSNNLTEKITLTGSKKPKDIALFLNASDLFIMGSYKEGWSTSLVEAVACGVPSCVTNFSSAKDIIINGRNGYVIDKHDPVEFVEGMFNSLKIPIPVYQSSQMEYGAKRLKDEILKIWNLV
jgi:glycosyltransferase involved in cell wall biosynthesis